MLPTFYAPLRRILAGLFVLAGPFWSSLKSLLSRFTSFMATSAACASSTSSACSKTLANSFSDLPWLATNSLSSAAASSPSSPNRSLTVILLK
ncbi:hypothetical protein OGAPHI_000044 [Ogataea philodendri]|uniref:Uncharacterized protein n=1 Tax=Ogataea philodendri TaxID=1378263 RepID=A0A9P8PGK7_9ASCO|nr:uncharacterized protein OGAPHI_000044 [Ogataea philodendri]KAH3671858.1 hypothetical protein OGAPHI_000044 [Ogataea philodendri]